MDDELMGVIKVFAGNFAPRGYMFCNGALLSIAQNTALFSILGTTYGGDGINTFALPNLNGRTPIGQGNSTTGKSYVLGEVGGTPQVTLLSSNLPSFTSQLKVANTNATSVTPTSVSSIAITGQPNGRQFDAIPSFVDGTPDTPINAMSVTYSGQNSPVNIMPPYVGLNYIICVEGIYPSRP
ncbi:phage tail protein [Chryseobacterium gambrini]|jgi:microcystin-dependent protein|uniref:Microcystin-dependent protein n=1 Tax=Chryseobacterium gambrini TaxID=373672 RepID=A0A1N7QGM5_9FLAO|nr:tail fiber protein [Chryseobacterium gambrini]SIT21914.1 Microcystin-dependent protein [Chryseobacterium gambrini]